MDGKKIAELTKDELRKEIRHVEEEMQKISKMIDETESVQATIRDQVHEIERIKEEYAEKIATERKRDA